MLKPGFEKPVSLEECKQQAEITELQAQSPIRAKVRFDYRGKARPSRFFFGGKSTEEAAGELRQQQAALWRNVPLQGVQIDHIELGEIYFVYDEEVDDEVAFAPMELDVVADSLDKLVRFAVREEFRRILIVEPERITMSKQQMEHLFFQVNDMVKTQVYLKAKKYFD
ncbi:MAG: hypothetical protein KGZ63_04905 [Clostridiales bacterium]|nr:hypothetical protein [Clostridiales bacterium]